VLNDKGVFARYDPETGERAYQARVAPGAAAFTASPWAYNGHVFALSEEGDTFVIDAADQYRLVRVNALDDFSMATPAIVGDRLLIRTQHRLYSIRHRK
jgi:outer membrane protein assembly factor BamB